VPSEDLFNELEGRELRTMEVLMTANAERAAITIEEYIQTRLVTGASAESIKEVLLQDLTEGGRIFGAFRAAVRATSRGSVNRVRDAAQYSELGVTEKYRWSAVLIDTCPDCLDRHGVVDTWEGWESQGLPRTGATVCKQFCHCMLLPAETAALEPIKRGGS